MHTSPIAKFISEHFRHFNAAALLDAAKAYKKHLKKNGKMLIALSGAMSTAEIGLSLAEMIRRGKVHAISCTGANLEEDIFNLVAHNLYERIPHYRTLTEQDEFRFFERKLNRVTDVCFPDDEIWNRLEQPLLNQWQLADKSGEQYFPHEFIYRILQSGEIKQHYQIDPKHSWVHAAMEQNLPIFVPGWEDSSIGNMFAGACLRGEIKNSNTIRFGVEYAIELSKWYKNLNKKNLIGLFQIGGGIAGNFPICVGLTLSQKLSQWNYFCRIGDSITSFGSFSGTVPAVNIPNFVIESDATIVAPLIFAFILDW